MKKQMNPEIKHKWIDALRSGNYRQGRKSLFNGNQYCCLGVLCDIYLKENNITEGKWYWKFTGFVDYQNQYNIPLSNGILPSYVANWAGFEIWPSKMNPIIEGKTLSLHNDEGKTFDQIADLIEKNL